MQLFTRYVCIECLNNQNPDIPKLRETLTNHGHEGEEVDINALMARTSLEMLGEAFLGYSFGGFVEGSRDSLGESIKQFLYVT